MITLLTKVQYKDFEPGEFVEVQKRTYDETIKLIEEFPWNRQRDNIVVNLTNPSITVEGKNGDYLKLAVFYNNKYVLLYLNKEQRLFSRSFPIRGFNILVPIIFLAVMVGLFRNAIILLWPGIIFIWGAVAPLRLFFSYYKYVKIKILIMSKANNTFYFGSFDNMVKYNKKDILQCTIVKSNGSRSIYKGYAVIKIEFNNGTMLSVPNLLIDHRALEDKLFQCRRIRKDETPYI